MSTFVCTTDPSRPFSKISNQEYICYLEYLNATVNSSDTNAISHQALANCSNTKCIVKNLHIELKLLKSRSRPSKINDPISLLKLLSPKEVEVLFRLASPDSFKIMANKMGISPYTIAGYAKTIYLKLNIAGREKCLLFLLQNKALLLNHFSMLTHSDESPIEPKAN